MSSYIFGFFYAILFVMLCKMFIETFGYKQRINNLAFRCTILGCLMLMLYIITVLLANNFALKEINILALTAFCFWIYFKQKVFETCVLVLLYQGIALTIDYATIIVVSKCFSRMTLEYLSRPMVNILLGALSQTMIFCCIMFLRRFLAHKSSEMLTSMEWIRFAVFPIFTIIVIIALLTGFEIPLNTYQKNILICIVFGLLVMNIVVFYLINDILKRETQIQENRILIERAKSEAENYDRRRKREHEFKNQISFIAKMVSDKKIDELSEYLKEYKNIVANLDLIDTNNVVVNSVLNLKYQEAKDKGIAFVVKVNDLSDLKIKDEDIVLILSNLLNNAIEASEKSEKPTIRVKFVKEGRQIVISVVNTLAERPLIYNNKIITAKKDNLEMHGIGISNIKATVEKYEGLCSIRYDKTYFRFVILIPQ